MTEGRSEAARRDITVNNIALTGMLIGTIAAILAFALPVDKPVIDVMAGIAITAAVVATFLWGTWRTRTGLIKPILAVGLAVLSLIGINNADSGDTAENGAPGQGQTTAATRELAWGSGYSFADGSVVGVKTPEAITFSGKATEHKGEPGVRLNVLIDNKSDNRFPTGFKFYRDGELVTAQFDPVNKINPKEFVGAGRRESFYVSVSGEISSKYEVAIEHNGNTVIFRDKN